MVRIADIDIAEFPLLLAPMEDVSDPPFRALCKKYGADLWKEDIEQYDKVCKVEPFQRGLKTLETDCMINGRTRWQGFERAWIDQVSLIVALTVGCFLFCPILFINLMLNSPLTSFHQHYSLKTPP